MRRTGPAIVLALSALLTPLVSEAQQQAGKVRRVGYLANLAQPSDARPPLALRDGLKALGYSEDKNITYTRFLSWS